ncbi:MAG: nucleotide sugar dehydrogenase [Aquificota bacterium]
MSSKGKNKFTKPKIGVVGTGYVGLIQAVGLAELGFEVVAYDIDPFKIEKLKKGESPIYEKNLDKLLQENLNRLHFTGDIKELKQAEVIFICVGTPQDAKGKANLSFVFSAVESLKPLLDGKQIIVLKSTVPVGTNRKVQELVGNKAFVVSNPEFLREGIAVWDFFNPERVVLGFGENTPQWVKEKIFSIYRFFQEKEIPFVVTNWESAELIKYASNTFLAMKISFVNELARLAEKTGADIKEISKGMGLDSRIGDKFLNAGIGWGGSCFHPKEVVFIKTETGLKVLEFHELENLKGKSIKILSSDSEKLSTERVKYLSRRFYQGEIYTIKLPLGREIKVTHDHPMLVFDGKTFKVKLANQLKEGEKVAVPLKGLEFEKTIELDLLKELSPKVESLRFQNKTIAVERFKKLRPYLRRKHPHDVKRTGVLTPTEVLTYERTLKGEKLDGKLSAVGNGKSILPRFLKLDKDLARLLGYFAAVGWISEDKTSKGYKRYKVGFAFHREETEYLEDLKRILKKIGLTYSVVKNGNAESVVVSSTPFGVLLKEVFETGTNSYDKAVPPQIFISTEEIKLEFLKGYLRGDGSIAALNGGKNLYAEFATASKKLAHGLLILLQNLGIVASIRKKRFNKSKVDTYLLRINGLTQLKKIVPLFGKKAEKYLPVLENYEREIKPLGFEKFGNLALFEVKEIEKEPYEGFVYSVETSNGWLVAGGGILVHNCFPKDVEALIWQFREHELEPKLPKATKEINEEQLIWFFNKIKKAYGGNLNGKTFALLGLAFKPYTDDLRESPALKLAELLIEEGAFIKGFDYVKGARENVRKLVEVKASTRYGYGLTVYDDLYETVKNTDGIIIAVEYKEWNKEDWNRIGEVVKDKKLFDGRNILDKDLVRELKQKGWHYEGVGVRI